MSSQIKIGDLTVNRLGYGAMRVLGPDIWGEARDRAGAIRLFRRAVELGINFFDTAESYGPQTDESLIAEALHPYPKGFVVATKCGVARPTPSRWDADGRPEKIRRDLEGSLRRLKLERIDLCQLHTIDPKVPFEESLGVMVEAQRAGKVRHIVVTNFNVKQLERARKVASIVSVQNRYSLAERSSEDVLAYCERAGIAFLPWYPLGDGRALKLAQVKKIANKTGATAAQVAVAWLLAKSPVMLPIPGTGNVKHLEENIAAAKLKLSKDDLAALD